MTNKKKIKEFKKQVDILDVESAALIQWQNRLTKKERLDQNKLIDDTKSKLLSLYKEAILRLEFCEKSRTLGERLSKAGSDEKRREILAEGKKLKEEIDKEALGGKE